MPASTTAPDALAGGIVVRNRVLAAPCTA